MITGIENVRDIFSIFHDGTIEKAIFSGGRLKMRISIPYIAKLINEEYEFFDVTLLGINNLSFSTWPSDLESPPEQILNATDIFKAELEILSADIKGDLISVVCNQHSSDFDYCGGELKFACVSGMVSDPSLVEYSIEELDNLCNQYWTDWSSRS